MLFIYLLFNKYSIYIFLLAAATAPAPALLPATAPATAAVSLGHNFS